MTNIIHKMIKIIKEKITKILLGDRKRIFLHFPVRPKLLQATQSHENQNFDTISLFTKEICLCLRRRIYTRYQKEYSNTTCLSLHGYGTHPTEFRHNLQNIFLSHTTSLFPKNKQSPTSTSDLHSLLERVQQYNFASPSIVPALTTKSWRNLYNIHASTYNRA